MSVVRKQAKDLVAGNRVRIDDETQLVSEVSLIEVKETDGLNQVWTFHVVDVSLENGRDIHFMSDYPVEVLV